MDPDLPDIVFMAKHLSRKTKRERIRETHLPCGDSTLSRSHLTTAGLAAFREDTRFYEKAGDDPKFQVQTGVPGLRQREKGDSPYDRTDTIN
ncbi:hypothetical protein E4U16_000493, partial [Claviceps sp. LM84 group G4]